MDKSWELVSSGPFIALKWRDEARLNNGKLNVPPKLSVVYYDEQQDEMCIEPVSFAVAGALAPEALYLLTEQLRKARDAQWHREKAEREAATANPVEKAA